MPNTHRPEPAGYLGRLTHTQLDNAGTPNYDELDADNRRAWAELDRWLNDFRARHNPS